VLAGRELHCGDCFQVQRHGQWIDTRIEHNSAGWYLVGIGCNPSLDGLICRPYS
jgi:hypothetical protein